MPKKSKALIHIGGSYLQLPSIRWAKELGLYVTVTDRNPRAPGRDIADQFEIVDGEDVPSLVDLARRMSQQHDVIGAYASNDFALPAVAAIAELVDQPACSYHATLHALDKSVSREVWEREGLSIPRGAVVETYSELVQAAEGIGLPVIVKPTDGSGSRGVRSVWDRLDLEGAFDVARGVSPRVVVEELVRGRHVDVNGLFVCGDFLPCGTVDRFFSEPPYHFPMWGCQPSSLSSDQESAAYELVERAARVLGLEAGPVKADVICTDAGPVILELAPRFHGDIVTAFVTPLVTSANPIKAWLAFVRDGTSPAWDIPRWRGQVAGWMALFPLETGTIASVVGAEQAMMVPGVQEVFVAVRPGSQVRTHVDNTSVCGFVWAVAPNRSELHGRLEEARSALEFVIE